MERTGVTGASQALAPRKSARAYMQPGAGKGRQPGGRPPLTLVELAVSGQASVLLLTRPLRLEVIELVAAPAGLVRKHHT